MMPITPSLDLLRRLPRWFSTNTNPIWLATRVTAIRNVEGKPFVLRGAERRRLLEQLEVLAGILGTGARLAIFDDYGGTDWWTERALWPPILTEDARLYLSAGEDRWLILGGQDHAVFSAVAVDPGNLDRLLDQVGLFERAFSRVGEPAYDEEYGYLTSSPRRAGAGLGVELILHLPGLMLTRQLRRLLSAAAQFGFWGTAVGPIGGGLVVLVNLVALKRGPEGIIESAGRLGKLLSGAEESARGALLSDRKRLIEDGVGRALGIVSRGTRYDEIEAGTLCSWLRLGRSLDLLRRPSMTRINVALWSLQAGLLSSLARWRSLTTGEARTAVLARLR